VAVVFFFVFSFVRRILFVLLLCLFISLFFFYFLVGFNIMGRCKSFFFCVVAIQTLLLCRLCFIQTKQKTITFFNVVRVIGISFSFTLLFIYFSYSHSYSFYLFLGIFFWFIYWKNAFNRQLFHLRKISKQH